MGTECLAWSVTAVARSGASPSGAILSFGITSFGLKMFVVLIFDVADVQKSIAPDTEIDECRLNTRFEIDDPAFVDVTYIVFQAISFDIEFFQHAVFDDGDSTFLGLENIDQHFFLHGTPFVW